MFAGRRSKSAPKVNAATRDRDEARAYDRKCGAAWDRYFASKPGTMRVPTCPVGIAPPAELDDDE